MREYGPCPGCGAMFKSRDRKTFCTLKCYTSSEIFKNRMRERNVRNAEASRETRQCPQCAVEFRIKKSGGRRFCCKEHKRLFYAERFDKWIASPQEIALPQAFDEFMLQNELPCLVKGCGWVGKSLAMHVNLAHGISSREFKKMAGFNVGTGLVSAELREALRGREHIHNATFGGMAQRGGHRRTDGYVSLEARESHSKARALITGTTPQNCASCGSLFFQKTKSHQYCSDKCAERKREERKRQQRPAPAQSPCCVCGQIFTKNRSTAKFCSSKCRSIGTYSEVRNRRAEVRGIPGVCAHCGTQFSKNRRADKKYCTIKCRDKARAIRRSE